ncbi:MAG: hypothetical protein ACLFN8_02125 [Candidatus Woesearchaeota archaeon]
MVRHFNKIILSLFILFVVFISACSTKYVCYDGSIESTSDRCPVVEQPKILQRQAENAAISFSSAYAQALGLRHNMISTYRDGVNWHSEVLFSGVSTDVVYRVILKIDGVSGRPSCIENCDFLFAQNDDVNKSVENMLNGSQEDINKGGSGFSVY